MASGNEMARWFPESGMPPASDYATLDDVNTTDPHSILDFDSGTDEATIFKGILPDNYAGGGLTLEIWFKMSTATTGNIEFEAAIERLGVEVQALDSSGFAAVQASGAVAVPGTLHHLKKATITFTSGGQMDSLLKNEPFRCKINRNVGVASDAAGDCELWGARLSET
jgi:hypothetical protein